MLINIELGEVRMEDRTVVLEMKNISKSFPGVKALDGVSFTLKKGTVHALMGENGAGKSTLMKCAFGLYDPDEGEVYFNGEKVHFENPKQGLEAGISMIHQELNPIRRRSIAENIWVGRMPEKKIAGISFIDHKKMYSDTQKLFDELHISVDPRKQAIELSSSILQLGEIARSISYGAKVIIMDEPTSSLTESETEILFEVIHRLTAEGIAIVYISHKIDEILKISDEVTIMRDGCKIGTWPAGELTEELIVNRMVGRQMENWFPTLDNTPGDVILEVKGLTSPNPMSFQDCSFTLRHGEILGIGGLVGAQRTELMEALFGIRAVKSGEIYKDGKKIKINSSADAIANKIGLLTEERRATGIIPGASVLDNTVLAKLGVYSNRFGMLDLKACRDDTDEYIQAMNIKTPTRDTRISDLSGGNQQKVLLARWLLTEPDILILDEPTRGIDVGAKYEIYTIMLQLAKQGKAIIMISSEMPELMGMSNRVMIMCEGHVTGFLEGEDIVDSKIMQFASKVS